MGSESLRERRALILQSRALMAIGFEAAGRIDFDLLAAISETAETEDPAAITGPVAEKLIDMMQVVAEERDFIGGLPHINPWLPALQMDERHPLALALMSLARGSLDPEERKRQARWQGTGTWLGPHPPEIDGKRAKYRGRFHLSDGRCVSTYMCADGKVRGTLWPGVRRGFDAARRLNIYMNTTAAARRHSAPAERRARELLESHLTPRQRDELATADLFRVMSLRSGILYEVRRLRPTLAFSLAHGPGRLLGALCMHPMGYYAQSWCGALPPSDDMLSHLQWIQADEHGYWRICHQHRMHEAEAGL